MNAIVLGAVLLAGVAMPALADDCAAVTAAMMTSAKTPYSETVSSSNETGQPMTIHIIQTATTKYIESNGKWRSMDISSADLVDRLNEKLKTAKLTCSRVGSDTVNGLATTIYTVQEKDEDSVIDGKLWVDAHSRQLKAEMNAGGHHYVTTTDFDHVQPPADATSVGAK